MRGVVFDGACLVYLWAGYCWLCCYGFYWNFYCL